jgi:hypothetical protein
LGGTHEADAIVARHHARGSVLCRYYQEAIAALLLVVGAFMIIAGGVIHAKIISRLEKEIAELKKRNDTETRESSNS